MPMILMNKRDLRIVNNRNNPVRGLIRGNNQVKGIPRAKHKSDLTDVTLSKGHDATRHTNWQNNNLFPMFAKHLAEVTTFVGIYSCLYKTKDVRITILKTILISIKSNRVRNPFTIHPKKKLYDLISNK